MHQQAQKYNIKQIQLRTMLYAQQNKNVKLYNLIYYVIIGGEKF